MKRTENLLLRLIRRHRLDVGDREILDQITVRIEGESARRRGMALDNTCTGGGKIERVSAPSRSPQDDETTS